MKILINTATTNKGGGLQVAKSFIDECGKIRNQEYHIILGENLSKIVKMDTYPSNMFFYVIGYRPADRVFSLRSKNNFFKDLEKKINPDVVFTTSGPAYWRPKAPHLVGYNLPHYIYRGSPFFSEISLLKRVKWDVKGAILKYFFKHDADAYVVQTNDVNQRLKKLLRVKDVYTVSNTISHYYKSPNKIANKLLPRKEGQFRLLTLSAWYPHKNLKIIPSVIDVLSSNLKENIHFVLTLPEEIFRREFPDKYHPYIVNIGPVKPEEGPSLYMECDALLLPTLLECFSASYVEAMAMGKPIITSDLGFAHSVCEDTALYVDPMNPEDIASTIKILMENKTLQEELKEKGFAKLKGFPSAKERAEQYLNICNQLSNAAKN